MRYLAIVLSLGMALVLATGFPAGARAADHMDLPVVKPIASCDQLAKVDLSKATGATVTVKSAAELPTPKGSFCKVKGIIEPDSNFEVDLPIEHWTQRLAMSAQGNLTISNAGSCVPSTNGELVVAVDDRGNSREREGWKSDPQKRIEFAYLLNHQTALLAKTLIKAFYGQPQRFSYFTGCSGGGREVLIEAQRFPNDFDGLSAGAADILLNIHNGGFFHGWEAHVNTRADGSIILSRSRLAVLHDAVVAHCAGASGALDDILQIPSACKFDPAWVQCSAGVPDTSKCLTAEEAAVAQKLYQGSSDSSGRQFEMSGFPLGSERMWSLSTAAGAGDRETRPGLDLRYLLPLPEANQPAAALDAAFRFDQEWFDKLGVLAPLYNGANTNLRPFQRHGGKLIMWQGAADSTVQQQTTIAYYQGVQKELGAQLTDSFMRYFLLPGVAHCGGGEGPAQIDVLSPLMAWVEEHRAPEMLVAGKPANQRSAIPSEGGQRGTPRGGPRYPYSSPAQPAVLKRPVYPFPDLARYTGSGDRNDPTNYQAVKSSPKIPKAPDTQALNLIGPNNQALYHVENGNLVAGKAR